MARQTKPALEKKLLAITDANFFQHFLGTKLQLCAVFFKSVIHYGITAHLQLRQNIFNSPRMPTDFIEITQA